MCFLCVSSLYSWITNKMTNIDSRKHIMTWLLLWNLELCSQNLNLFTAYLLLVETWRMFERAIFIRSWISFDQLSLRKRLYFFSKTYPIGKSFRKVRKHVDYKEVALWKFMLHGVIFAATPMYCLGLHTSCIARIYSYLLIYIKLKCVSDYSIEKRV